MRIAFALSCAGLLACFGAVPSLADELSCSNIKRALVSANLEFMRIERGPLPVAPVQASLVIGQMSALTQLAKLACDEADARQIAKVVGIRLQPLQALLPIGSSPPPAGDETAADAPEPPPSPPPSPPSEARRESARKSASSGGCHRTYYTRDGHRYWRCRR